MTTLPACYFHHLIEVAFSIGLMLLRLAQHRGNTNVNYNNFIRVFSFHPVITQLDRAVTRVLGKLCVPMISEYL